MDELQPEETLENQGERVSENREMSNLEEESSQQVAEQNAEELLPNETEAPTREREEEEENNQIPNDDKPGPSTRMTTRVGKRTMNQPLDMNEDGPSTSLLARGRLNQVGEGIPIQRKIFIRKKKTPEELIEHDRDMLILQQSRGVPGAPGRRGRRPTGNPANDTPLTRTEAARRSGRPTVVHPSGVEFAIPISLEAHPIPLSDTIPENPNFDILRDDKGMPYCTQCHSVLKSWHAIEYHVMHVHLKYRPYRCMYCVKEYFYTEEECISHIKSNHAGKPLSFIRELNETKEEESQKFFQALFVMIREGEDFSDERVVQIQQTAYHHMQKFHRMRFKVPEVVARQKSQRDATAQTFVTMAAPQTMVTAPVKPPQPHHYRREHPQDMMTGQVKMVRLVNGEYARVIREDGDTFIVDRDMEVDAEYEHDQIDVVEHEIDHHHYQ